MADQDATTDWRLFGDHERLRGARLWWRAYTPRNEIWAQDHCEFCWATFARIDADAWHEGYTTQAPRRQTSSDDPLPTAVQDEYLTEVLAAVRLPISAEAAEPAVPDLPLDADALAALTMPASRAESPRAEPIVWICPRCFADFQEYFGWALGVAG